MPNIATTLTINDGSATPVAIAYSLERRIDGGAMWVDRRLGSRELQPELTMTSKVPSAKARAYTGERSVKMPIVRSVNGVDTVVGYNKKFTTYVFDKASTEQERKHLIAAGNNLDAHADSVTNGQKLEGFN